MVEEAGHGPDQISVRIHKEGFRFVGTFLFSGIVMVSIAGSSGSVFAGFLAGIMFLLAGYCAYFFRDPVRVIPRVEKGQLSPADGKILEVVEGRDAVTESPVWIIRIFLSIFDVHIQRSPVKGTVRKIRYIKGKFLDARNPKAAFENEQNRVEIEMQDGRTLVVTQIAGLIARRIVCSVREGQRLEAGQQIGLIRFGSQVDMVIPGSMNVKVKTGDVVKAGITLIAEGK